MRSFYRLPTHQHHFHIRSGYPGAGLDWDSALSHAISLIGVYDDTDWRRHFDPLRQLHKGRSILRQGVPCSLTRRWQEVQTEKRKVVFLRLFPVAYGRGSAGREA